jgi:hypothetical protein
MPTQGPFTWFNEALEHVDADEMAADSFRAMLCTASQVLDPEFVGASGNCTYADLTAELATANGYTNGGLLLSGVTLSRSTNIIKWTCSTIQWTLSGSISFRYLVIRNAIDGRLLCFSDVYSDGGAGVNLTASPGILGFAPTSGGVLSLTRV